MQSTITTFIQQTFQNQNSSTAIVGVSGGIDSAVVLTLLVKALGPTHVIPVFLPFGTQDMSDAHRIAAYNAIPESRWCTRDIQPFVLPIQSATHADQFRTGNIKARVRMIVLFDIAKQYSALVCGTENKSEHYLGYFTRFGDGASDVEPIIHLYKTQVRQIARELGIPEIFLTKAPSADLWEGQTDEVELGFSYEQADRALAVLLNESSEKVDPIVLEKVKERVESQAFKRLTPYVPIINSTISPSAMM